MARKTLAVVLLITGGVLGLVVTFCGVLVVVTISGESVSYEAVLPHLLIGFLVGQTIAVIFFVRTIMKGS